MPHDGAPADVVYQLLKDELDLDGRPNLNLASFVGTYMEKQAEKLMVENLSKNMSDVDEFAFEVSGNEVNWEKEWNVVSKEEMQGG